VTNIFFHIGLHKTATSWFQRHLFPNLAGVQFLKTRNLDKVILADDSTSTTLIISHEGLSGTVSHQRPPGTSSTRLMKNLEKMAALAPRRSIIIGFREHRSWLQSAHAQRAKKVWGVGRARYVRAFSLEDLSWCQKLSTIERSCPSVFPFLYEELLQNPMALIQDLCGFLGKDLPPNLDHLLGIRINAVPKSRVGQFVSRSLCTLSTPSRRRRMKARWYKFGARFDRYFLPKPLPLDSNMAVALEQDWNDLLRLIGERRGRDFSSLIEQGTGGQQHRSFGSSSFRPS
jgi:hypothetical protein